MKPDLIDFVDKFKGKRILIIGDMIADIYLEGDISRISREAPVLVLIEKEEKTVPGGAANVVNNVATLGGKAFAVGILGKDRGALNLKHTLEENGVNTDGMFCDQTRKTITKTRVIAGGRATVSQQVVRIDRECNTSISSAYEKEVLKYIEMIMPQIQGVVMSDYGSDTITTNIKEFILK